MTQSAAFRLGSAVGCRDGAVGELKRIVLDPATSGVTHLVVKPRFRRHARLVPVALVAAASTDGITLSCSASEFKALEPAEETEFLEEPAAGWVTAGPPAQAEVITGGGVGGGWVAERAGPRAVSQDRVPAGEVEIRQGDRVYATDDVVGHVVGLVVDSSDEHITHVLVEEGHLRHRRIAVPIAEVSDVSDVLRLSITRSEVAALPPSPS
jgi:hypothetical protein